MNNSARSLTTLQREAAEYLDAGQKQAARNLLEEALQLDRNNLVTWELLWHAAYTQEEELISLRRILKLNPKHAEARQRLTTLQPTAMHDSLSAPASRTGSRRSSSRRNRQQASWLLSLLGVFLLVLCVGITGFALYRGGYVPFLFSNLTATALSERNASCQALIDRTIQASANYCNNTGSNTACYGNNTLRADLMPNVSQRFSQRGDVIGVGGLRRLSASPLNLQQNEWGIAVFKVIANLPRSQPGQTVTMVVFGNATLDNQSAGTNSLESFYFSSELGQVVCEKIPFDGLMVTSPDGSGIRFSINGSELTLAGNANIKAIRNGKMEVSVYKGSARIVANGQEQYFGAGQKVSVQLGGANGSQAVSGPSQPEALSGQELTMACTLSGQYCTPSEIQPISPAQAQQDIQNAITATPSPVPTPTITRTPSPTEPPTYTVVVLPTITPSATRTRTPAPTKPPTKTKTKSPTQTPTGLPPTGQPPTATIGTPPTNTPIGPLAPVCSTVFISALTNPNPNELSMDITNSNAGMITMNRFFAFWVKSPTSQKIDRLIFNNVLVWNTSDPDSPTDIPLEGNFISGADLTIPATSTRTLLVQFPNALQPTGYEVHIVFDLKCQVIQTK